MDELEREDFTRLKLVKGKKEVEAKLEAKRKAETPDKVNKRMGKENDADITAAFDAGDDADVVF